MIPDEQITLKESPVPLVFVSGIENVLEEMFTSHTMSSRMKLFPLSLLGTNVIGCEMIQELKESWKIFRTTPDDQLGSDLSIGAFLKLQGRIVHIKTGLQEFIFESMTYGRTSVTDKLLELTNHVPTIQLTDLIRGSYDSQWLHKLNPRLPQRVIVKLQSFCINFMEICVLEDKIERIMDGLKHGESEAWFLQELKCRRTWSPSKHPRWLTFEVEGRLQIRPEQYIVAKHLIDHPGSATQLNMGKGKTRVILPMLVMYFLHQDEESKGMILRAFFLKSLLSETWNHMHRHLTGSVMSIRFYLQPFHRRIELNQKHLNRMQDSLDACRILKGFQMLAPEHKLSLELKQLESNSEVDELNNVTGAEYLNIFDECDEMLSHRYALVYSIGTTDHLESGRERWLTAQALLRVLNGTDPAITDLLDLPNVSSRYSDEEICAGGYRGIRLIGGLENTREIRKKLKQVLIRKVIESPPYELSWFTSLDHQVIEQVIVSTTDASRQIDQEWLKSCLSQVEQGDFILALRGLLAYGILESCLEKRDRVDYGLCPSREKELAVPFTAADLPTERSEFTHPDVSIVLTLLAYYHSGLTKAQCNRLFEVLLSFDESVQEFYYKRWYKAVESSLDEADKTTIDTVLKIDTSNEVQSDLLYQVYHRGIEPINFFLNYCVFPRDTKQYCKQIQRTAWHLPDRSKSIGFSGTNDNHRLLPLQMTQREPDVASLRGTNGKMASLMMDYCHGYEAICMPERNIPLWQSLLTFACEKQVGALIDTGALLAGVSNANAAAHVATRVSCLGVSYFDTNLKCWCVLERETGKTTPLVECSVQERDTFVIFDDARTRGSDMKLKPDTVAMLTLGTGITKDKLMQGAGRMRQLGGDQKLWLTSFQDVEKNIQERCQVKDHLSILHVLNWVMLNTTMASMSGISERAEKGFHYAEALRDKTKEILHDDWALNSMYTGALEETTLTNVVESKACRMHETCTDRPEISKVICEQSIKYGNDIETVVSNHSEECEREMQEEEEQQRERQVEFDRTKAVEDVEWDYSIIGSVKTIQELKQWITIRPISDILESMKEHRKQLLTIKWKETKIFMTENFTKTVNSTNSNHHLRVADAILLFPDASLLLISDYEACQILAELWKVGVKGVTLVNFEHLRSWAENRNGKRRVRLATNTNDMAYNSISIAALELINGETSGDNALCDLLETESARNHAYEFVKIRGTTHRWTRSDL